MKNSKKCKSEIQCRIISHNAFGYNGDDVYIVDIKTVNDIESAKEQEKWVSDRDRCMGTEMIFVYRDRIITEPEVRGILKEKI